MHLEDGNAVIVIEGRAVEIRDPNGAVGVSSNAYNPKYDWNFTPDQLAAGVFAVCPERRSHGWAVKAKHLGAPRRAGDSRAIIHPDG